MNIMNKRIHIWFDVKEKKAMLIPINVGEEMAINDTVVIDNPTFKQLNFKEADVEEFLRKNIEIIFGEEESLLIVIQSIKSLNFSAIFTLVNNFPNFI
jgi:hypothetical protein